MEFCLWMIMLILVGIQNVLCIIIGLKIGTALVATDKGEKVEIPSVNLSVNPVKAVKEHKAKKEAEMEQNKYDTILRNLENYDGTGFGQEDVPGR